jgi:2-polyprenyl-3-methyl-5-hydroxy-6-metoxy-1,4-benzoquinol methylase
VLELATEIGWLQRAVVSRLDVRPARLLEVGCGSKRHFGLLADHVTGIDPDEAAIRANPALDESICGRVETLDLGTERFDAIICWNVLEHLDDPRLVVTKMSRALRRGGILVIALPNAASARGRLTRFTPTSFHRIVLRRVLRGKTSEPYPTKIGRDHHPARLLETIRTEGLDPLHIRFYEGYYERRLRELRPALYAIWKSGTHALAAATLGRVDTRSDVLMAFEKPPFGRLRTRGGVAELVARA